MLSVKVQQLHCFPVLLLFTSTIVQLRPAKGKEVSGKGWQRCQWAMPPRLRASFEHGDEPGDPPPVHGRSGPRAKPAALNGSLGAARKELGAVAATGLWWRRRAQVRGPSDARGSLPARKEQRFPKERAKPGT